MVHVTRASSQIVLDSWQQASSRIAQTECTHLPELLVHRANQWASMDMCDKKRGGCGAIMNYFHLAASIAHKEAKAKTEGKKKEDTTISQRAAQIVESVKTEESKDVACPRCDRELHVFNTASGPILRCRLAGTPCTLIKACHSGAVVPGGFRSTNRTGGGSSASGSGGPGTLPRRDEGTPPERLHCPGASSGGKPSLGTVPVRPMATSEPTVSASSISTAARGGVDNGSLASASRGRRIHWGLLEYGHGNGSD